MLDASVTLGWFFEDEDSPVARGLKARTTKQTVHVPALWITEVSNSLRLAERKQWIGVDAVARFGRLVREWVIAIDPVDVDRVLGYTIAFARDHGLTVYDASYLELAHRLGLPLATLDRELIAAAPSAHVRLLED